MLTAFWQAVGGKLADRWAAVSVPALMFWLGGLAAWTYHRGGLHTLTVQTRWLDRQTTATQVTVILTVLLTVAASGILVNRLSTPVLRLLEGYWPSWTGPLRHRLTGWLAERAIAEAPAWQPAYDRVRPPATPTAHELATYTRLERRRRRRPSAAGYFLPTPIGNILRAAERRPIDKYGLDTVALWPRLWLVLPDTTRARNCSPPAPASTTPSPPRSGGCCSAPSPPSPPWPSPSASPSPPWPSPSSCPARAQVFGDLIEAAYDLHRTALYRQLRWPLPANPEQEHACGQQLTSYLWRGSDDTTPTFTPPT